MDLKEIPTDELAAEIERRKKIEEEAVRPKLVAEPDLIRLRASCQTYINELAEHGYVDSDLKHYIFEDAMTALFGKDVFKWINAHTR